jgi:hypothetical protein
MYNDGARIVEQHTNPINRSVSSMILLCNNLLKTKLLSSLSIFLLFSVVERTNTPT